MEREEDVLDVRHLSIRFGSLGVLRDLTFHVPAGTTLAILGPNGAGKTVLFKALIGAIAHEGDIEWKAGTRIGYVPQKLDLERDVPITGVDFLRARAALAREADVNISRTLDLVGVSMDVARRPIGILSGGQFQRLLVAFALVGNPTVLLLDEPTVGLDPVLRRDLWQTFANLASAGATVLVSSHVMDEARRCDELLLLREGRLLAAGQVDDILRRTGAGDLDEAFLRLVEARTA